MSYPSKRVISAAMYTCVVVFFLLSVSVAGAKWWVETQPNSRAAHTATLITH